MWEKAKIDQLLQNACEIFWCCTKKIAGQVLTPFSFLPSAQKDMQILSGAHQLSRVHFPGDHLFCTTEQSVIVGTSTINLGIVFVSNCVRNMKNAVSGGITLKMQKYCKHVHSPGQPALGGCAWAISRWPPQVLSNCSLSVTLWQSNYKGGPYSCHIHWHQSLAFFGEEWWSCIRQLLDEQYCVLKMSYFLFLLWKLFSCLLCHFKIPVSLSPSLSKLTYHEGPRPAVMLPGANLCSSHCLWRLFFPSFVSAFVMLAGQPRGILFTNSQWVSAQKEDQNGH